MKAGAVYGDPVDRTRPKSVIGQLPSNSQEQTFAVLLHRQDGAHGYRSRAPRRICPGVATVSI